jgi:PAS domain S-box-containing protein
MRLNSALPSSASAPGEHLCLLYETADEHDAAVVPYLRAGLAADERCLYVGDGPAAARVAAHLAAAGVDVTSAMAEARLRFTTGEPAADAACAADAAVAHWRAELADARRAGRAGLRVAADVACLLGDAAPDAAPEGLLDRALAYERCLHAALDGAGLRALCQYDARRLPVAAQLRALAAHPGAVVDGHTCPNPYYEPTDDAGDGPTARLARRVARLRAAGGPAPAVADATSAAAAVRASREFSDVLLDASPDCVKLLDLDGRLEFMNTPGQCLMELDDFGPVRGADWATFWPGAGRALARDAVRTALGGSTGRFAGFCPTARGTPKWWDVTVTPVRDRAGAIVRLLSVSRDITESRRAEAAVREGEARLAEAQRVGRIGSWELDLATGAIRWSAELFRLFGLEPQDAPLTIDRFYAAIHPDDRDRFRAELQGELAAARDYEFTVRVLWPDGTVRALRGRGAMRRGPDGRVARVVGTAQDVTEQVAAEVALRESERRLHLALDVAGMVVWERDLRTGRLRDDGIFRAGREAGSLDAVAFGDYAGFLAVVHPDDRDRVVRANAEAVAGVGGFAVEYRIVSPGGATRWHRTVGRAIAGAGGVPERLVGVSLDVTDQRTLEAQLRQAQKMEAVGQLAGGVAHDFNNLLMIVTGSTEFARESLPAGAPALEDLAAVDEAARRAAQLTRQLLAFSRRQVLKAELLDLDRVVRGVEPLLRRLIGEDITVLTLPAGDVRPVLADPGQLEQVLVNLAVNARDAMPAGGRLVIETANVRLTRADAERRGAGVPPGDYVRLRVRDTGTGMDDATLGQIFEPFFTTKPPGKGSGLGLSTVYGIVKQSGGFVWVTSAPGEGTTFEIDLPAANGAPVAAAAAHPAPTAARGTETVLLVEDDASVRLSVRRILTRAGYTVLEAPHGRDALAVAASHPGRVDLVVTDVVMPEMNGRDLVERFAARRPGVPALFMSGYTDDEMVRRGLGAPGTAFLEKPFSAATLLRTVRGVLDATPATPVATGAAD